MRCALDVLGTAGIAFAAVLAGSSCGGSGDGGGLPSVPREVDLARWDPSFYRDDEVSLDGEWRFRKDPARQGEMLGLHEAAGIAKYDQAIVVPYPWQSTLSGIASVTGPYAPRGTEAAYPTYRGVAWYARTVAVPATRPAGGRTAVRFGAVDWKARVFVDGELAGTHEGGFDPFEIDVTRWATPGGTFHLAVEADDPCDGDPSILTGMQGGPWYTCSGGIWQSVALAWRPATFVAAVRDVPGKAAGAMTTRVTVAGTEGPAEVRVTWRCMEGCPSSCGPTQVAVPVNVTADGATVDVAVQVPAEDEWSPDSPCLAGRAIEVTDANGVTDTVRGYFGTRRIRIGAMPGADAASPAQPYGAILVNDRMAYVRGALDPGYHPEGILQSPSLEARREDLAFLKDAGFNAVRIHLKPEEPRVYAMADALGLFVIYDLPSPAPSGEPGPGAAWNGAFDHLLEAAIGRDANHPSILWWVPFHEATGLRTPPFWTGEEGIAFVKDRYARAKALDPTRPVEDNSPTMYDGHAESDLATWHAYSSDIPFFEEITSLLETGMTAGGAGLLYGGGSWTGQPWIATEVGGLAANDTRGDQGFLVHGLMNVLRRHPALVGFVFGQAHDVEWQLNGLRTYDRREKDFGLDELGLGLPDLFGEAYLVLGQVPIVAAKPGDAVKVAAGLSTPETVDAGSLETELRRRDGTVVAKASRPAPRCGTGYTSLGDVEATLPSDVDDVYVLAAALRVDGRVVARNASYVVADAGDLGKPGIGQARLENWGGWVEGSGGCVQGACFCEKDCAITYTVYGLGYGRRHLHLVAEVAPRESEMYQTDGRPYPSRLEVEIYGETVATADLPDAPNDHRGVLSLSRSYAGLRGAYGQLVDLDLGTRDVTDAITVRLRAVGGGLTLFGRDGGRTLEYPRIEWDEVK